MLPFLGTGTPTPLKIIIFLDRYPHIWLDWHPPKLSRCWNHIHIVRDGWILGKNPNGLWPPSPHFIGWVDQVSEANIQIDLLIVSRSALSTLNSHKLTVSHLKWFQSWPMLLSSTTGAIRTRAQWLRNSAIETEKTRTEYSLVIERTDRTDRTGRKYRTDRTDKTDTTDIWTKLSR